MNPQENGHHWTDWVPGLRVLSTYERSFLPRDLVAGVVVVMVLIPSAIAYADLANCQPVAGLYAALGGMVLFALFTSTRHVIVGPDAAIAILVGAAIGPIAASDPGQAIVLSTWLAMLVAAILLVAAWLKLGAVAELLSSPVMVGFMNGAAVVIIVSQIGKLCGIGLDEDNTLLRTLEWIQRLGETKGTTLALGLAAMLLLVAFRIWLPIVPGTIVVFVLALLAGRVVEFTTWNVAVIGEVDTRIPTPVPPELSLSEIGRLMTGALGLSLLIFPGGILLGRAMAQRHNYELQPNRELFALGMANLAAGLFRSFAVGASQSRTLLNSSTGGCTQMVSLIAAGLLVAFMAFLAPWIASVPTVAIAAILIFTGITLIDASSCRQLMQLNPYSGWVALITSLGVIGLGVLPGILVGIVLSLLKVLSQIMRPHDALLGRVPGSAGMHDVGDHEAVKTIPGLVVYRFYGALIFANVRYFIERLDRFIEQEKTPVRQVILDARAIPDLDITAVQQLTDYFRRLQNRGIKVVISQMHLPLREAATALGLNEVLDESHYVRHLSDAVATYELSSG